MTSRPEFRDGAPCWIDLSTPDPASAQRFYASLFDWSFDAPDPQKGGYVNIRLGGRRVAGLMTKQPGDPTPPAWGVWLRTSDAEATARKFTELGGNLLHPAMDVADLGRMTFGIDPAGAFIGFWQPGTHRGAELVDVPGAMCWHEVYTRDADTTDRFYQALHGYTTSIPEGPADGSCEGMGGNAYRLYNLGGEPVCGRMQITEQFPPNVPPHWLTYFSIADVDAGAAKIEALGGKLLHPLMDTPHGRLVTVMDPYGAAFAIIQRPAHSA